MKLQYTKLLEKIDVFMHAIRQSQILDNERESPNSRLFSKITDICIAINWCSSIYVHIRSNIKYSECIPCKSFTETIKHHPPYLSFEITVTLAVGK